MAAPEYTRTLDPRNAPYPPQPLQQGPPFSSPRREYDDASELGDHYNSMNSSTARLAGSPGYYDQNNGLCIFESIVLSMLTYSHRA